MAILVECTNCGRKYNADEHMAGKRIKCRNCGQVFLIPQMATSEGDDPDSSLAALEQLERSVQTGEPATHSAGGHSQSQPSFEQSAANEDEPLPSAALGRPNIRFSFPGADAVDRFLPLVLVLGCCGWVVAAGFQFDKTGQSWLVLCRFGVMLLVYSALVFPLTLAGIRMAGRNLGFQLPRTARWRAFASFMPAFALGAVLWMVGQDTRSLLLGLFVGVAVSCGAMILLFRLRPEELPTTSGYAAGLFGTAIVIAGVILFGMNLLLWNVLAATKKANDIPGSPLGVGLSWNRVSDDKTLVAKGPKPTVEADAPAQPPKPAPQDPSKPPKSADQGADSNPPKPTGDEPHPGKPNIFDNSEPSNSGNSPTPKPTGEHGPADVADPTNPSSLPKITSPLIRSLACAAITDPIDQVIWPASTSRFGAVLHRDGDRGRIDRVASTQASPSDPAAWQPSGTAPYTRDPSQRDHFALSPDGSMLARIASFPSLSLQVFTFDGKAPLTVKTDAQGGETDIFGFAGDDQVLVMRDTGNDFGFGVFNPHSATPPRSFISARVEKTGSPVTVSADGRLLAIASKWKLPRAPEPRPALLLYPLPSGNDPMPIFIDDLDVRWSTAPSGLAFAPSTGRQNQGRIAVLYEQGPNGLLLIYKTLRGEDRKPLVSRLYPVMPAQSTGKWEGSSLVWLSDDVLLLYGRVLIDATSGESLGDLGIPDVISQHVTRPDLVELLCSHEGGPKRIISVSLNGEEITKALHKK